MTPDWIFGGWVHSWHHESHFSMILDMCTNFQLSSMNKSLSRTRCLWSYDLRALVAADRVLVILGGYRWFLGDYLWVWAIPDIVDQIYLWFITWMSNCSSPACIDMCQEHLIFEVIHVEHWWSMTGHFEDGVICDIIYHSYMWFISCLPIFSSLAWIKMGRKQSGLEVLLGGCWCFLIRYMENGYFCILDHHNNCNSSIVC